MTGQIVSQRFGQDAPARFAASTPMLMEATEMFPQEWVLPNLIPFYPAASDGSTSSGFILDADGNRVWTKFPSRLDLVFYQGDDVMIPLYIQDPNNPLMDMSDQAEWEWHAQIRVLHSHRSTFVNDFIVDSQYFPPVAPETVGKTLVQLLMPRDLNIYWGVYQWELYSVSPFDYSNFTEPAGWPDDEVWPPTTALKTWLWGQCTIQPRTSTTDVLPATTGGPVWPDIPPAGWTSPFVVGPNGRVP
jgi:hypothetical protein